MSCLKTLKIVCPPVDGEVIWSELEVYVNDPIDVCFAANANGTLQGPATGTEFAIALEQSFAGVFTRRVADTLYIEGAALDVCCGVEGGVTDVVLRGQDVPALQWAIDCCTPSAPTPCPPCGCEDIGCFAVCDRVELPIEAEADGTYVMTAHVGDALTFQQDAFLLTGQRPLLNLRRIGQLGRFKVTVMDRCFEFQVIQVASA